MYIYYLETNFTVPVNLKSISQLIHHQKIGNYCWWKKLCTRWYGKYPIPLFTGFYTSQVLQDFYHQQDVRNLNTPHITISHSLEGTSEVNGTLYQRSSSKSRYPSDTAPVEQPGVFRNAMETCDGNYLKVADFLKTKYSAKWSVLSTLQAWWY